MKEMADGTIRVSIDIDPPHRALFLELFPNIDTPVALAPLNLNAGAQEQDGTDKAETTAASPAPIGPLCKLAVQWCKDEKFWQFLNEALEGDERVESEDAAKDFIGVTCQVISRRELDVYPDAAKTFHELIRIPYMEWQKAQTS